MTYKLLKQYQDGARRLLLSDGNNITVNEKNVIFYIAHPERLQDYKTAGVCKTRFFRHLMGHTDYILNI